MLRGWERADLAAEIGVTSETIRKWETGESAVTVRQIERVATVLRVTTHDLIHEIPARDMSGAAAAPGTPSAPEVRPAGAVFDGKARDAATQTSEG